MVEYEEEQFWWEGVNGTDAWGVWHEVEGELGTFVAHDERIEEVDHHVARERGGTGLSGYNLRADRVQQRRGFCLYMGLAMDEVVSLSPLSICVRRHPTRPLRSCVLAQQVPQ